MSTIRDDDAKMRAVERETMTLKQIEDAERLAQYRLYPARDNHVGIGDLLVFFFVAPAGLLAVAFVFYWLGTH